MLIHLIWVGEKEIPEPFVANSSRIKKDNPDDKVMEWNDNSLFELLELYGFNHLYQTSSIFHKLQIARYIVLDYYGGLYTDYDVYWKMSIAEALNTKDKKDLIFIKRNSLFFYKKEVVHRLHLLDDYVIFAEPRITKGFLDYSLERSKVETRLKGDKTEPFSVYSLTEWIFDSDFEIDYFSHEEIYNNTECTIAYHDNKKTWNML